MQINELCKETHKIAKEHGFWESKNIPEKIMLVVTELSEAVEALRKDYRQPCTIVKEYGEGVYIDIPVAKGEVGWKKDTVEDELADAIIRIADLCEYMHIDLEWQIKKKIEYNKTRPNKHGKEF